MSEVVVLGAGPAGLAAALSAAQAGYSCTVLEASAAVGGMAGSFEIEGQSVDFGSHRLHPASPPWVLTLLQELLGDDLQVRPRTGRLDFGGHWIGFPLRTANIVRSFPPSLTARLAFDSGAAATRGLSRSLRSAVGLEPHAAPSSFAAEVASRLGRSVLEQFYGPYARKLYGIAPEALHPYLARRRVSATSPLVIARRLAGTRRPGAQTFLYPRHGYGQIAECLAQAAVDAGATIRLSSPVERVELRADGVGVTTPLESIEAGLVLSTLPLTVLGSLVRPAPPPEVADALRTVRTRSMVLVYLVLNQPHYTPFDAHYLPGLNTTVARLSEPKNYRIGDDPPDRTVLCAEIACWRGDEIWTSSDAALSDLVASDLERVGLPPVVPSKCEVRRLGSVYPVLDIAGATDRATIANWLPRSGRLISLGRQGLRGLDNLHHAMTMGAAIADVLKLGVTIDAERWHEHLAAFAAHTVED